jgi:hypothetical protein
MVQNTRRSPVARVCDEAVGDVLQLCGHSSANACFAFVVPAPLSERLRFFAGGSAMFGLENFEISNFLPKIISRSV